MGSHHALLCSESEKSLLGNNNDRLPVLVIIGSGLLLQVKKQWPRVQPEERKGTGTSPRIGLDEVLVAVQGVPELNVTGWDDIQRLDIRPGRGLAKVSLKNGWEVQVDLGTGRVLQSAFRRSDQIESIHDGSVFGGDWGKLGVFFPSGLILLLMWGKGLWMFWVPLVARLRRRKGRTVTGS